METLYESMKKMRCYNHLTENLANFVYGITSIHPRSMDKNVLKTFALSNVKEWSLQEPSDKEGYIWKMLAKGPISDKSQFEFISCTFNKKLER